MVTNDHAVRFTKISNNPIYVNVVEVNEYIEQQPTQTIYVSRSMIG